ncbi:uncharacterized protein AMSG_06923 [Thecamonas trahens ATCC 50062]|uniref:DUF1565 domain-containing protein n=1 Tax=Thecamonas trahens ATCC 50062 TaxID=461836 RepID=A0A0L0DDK2_THETB|nr:hypothetical protein AMSG_06923 [Thecamonas trahens ATCC 50062]KNC50427.1 hypothetical protein AMSG_06923 [Thecamonas trahens ATCC 50062]|eukprot:XP_013756967.1 hypothetical protein AMSG_06923 [Thecamonas trahens ATCC 50062]
MGKYLCVACMLAVVVVVGMSVEAEASVRTVFVSPTGSDSNSGSESYPFATLGHAITSAGENGTVNVLAGVYTRIPSIDVDGIVINGYPDLKPRKHVISFLHTYPSPVLSISAKRVIINGIGFSQSRGYAGTYGAVHIARPAEVAMQQCEFWDNSVGISVMGGSVAVGQTAFSTILSDGKSGTAVLMQYGDFGNGGQAALENAVVYGGTDLSSAKGTAVKISGGPATFEAFNTVFANLAAVSTMGYINKDVQLVFSSANVTGTTRAFYAYGMQQPGRGQLTIENSVVANGGGSDVDGPGVSVGSGVTASMSVIDSTLVDNSAADGSPAWCSSSCGFVADNVSSQHNTAKSQTGKCPGV